jgi:hypothetical protein
MTYLTASGNTKIADRGYGLLVTVNTALTGTLTVKDGTTTVAVITNPTVGSQYYYYGFNSSINVNPSATCDVTCSILQR